VSDWNPSRFHALDEYLEIADKHVVHLSLDRAARETPQPYALTRIVDTILREFGTFTDAAERANSPFAVAFRAGLSEALYLKDHAPEGWPPEVGGPTSD